MRSFLPVTGWDHTPRQDVHERHLSKVIFISLVSGVVNVVCYCHGRVNRRFLLLAFLILKHLVCDLIDDGRLLGEGY